MSPSNLDGLHFLHSALSRNIQAAARRTGSPLPTHCRPRTSPQLSFAREVEFKVLFLSKDSWGCSSISRVPASMCETLASVFSMA